MSSENNYIGFKRKGYFDPKSIYGQVVINNDQSEIEEKDEVIEISSDSEENEQKMNSLNETSTNIKSCKIILFCITFKL